MTEKERKDLEARKRILDACGIENFSLTDKSGKIVYTKRTYASAEAHRRDLEKQKISGKTVEERKKAADELRVLEKLDRVLDSKAVCERVVTDD